jgi:Holliday junction resolvase RusA-like endonuclease
MQRIDIWAPIVPKAQRRPRAMGFVDASGRARARVYKSPEAQTDEEDLYWHLVNHKNRPEKPLVGPLGLNLRVFLPRPKSSKRILPDVKPDLDNYIKFALDCLTRARYWEDDKQICSIFANKCYTNGSLFSLGWFISIFKKS